MQANERNDARAPLDDVQTANRKWWTDHTMSYDWNDRIPHERFSAAHFDEMDRRFIHGARLFAHENAPFDRIIPFAQLAGRDVLEIGCGMGLHSELIARAGARLTSIDISETSAEATTRRFEQKGLRATIRRMDACALDFPDESFDFVWSWGVIHHSAQTALILREIARVTRPGGEARIMVYNLDGMSAYATILRDYLFGFWRGRSLDECLWGRADGFLARHYSKDSLRDVARLFFSDIRFETFGQDADAIPLPRRLRAFFLRRMSEERVARWANARGSFLFAVMRK